MKLKALIVTVVVVVLTAGIGGCLDSVKRAEVEKHLVTTARLVKTIDGKLDALEVEAAKDTTPAALRKIHEKIDRYKEQREEIVTAAEVFTEHAENGDALGGIVAAAAPWMGPYGGVAVAATPILLGLLSYLKQKTDQKKDKAAAIAAIRNVDVIVNSETGGPIGTINFKDHEVRAKMREMDMAVPGTVELVAEALK